MIILACAGSLPGYWAAILTIDTLGRKPIQIIGFILLTILFAIIGFSWSHLSEKSLLALYVMAQFFFNWGPNTTTFIVPGECFPTRYRSTGHGLSAAMGKIGAILAQVISIPLLARDQTCSGGVCTSPWLDRLMKIFALFMLAGTFVTLLIPETKGFTLEELSGETPTSYNSAVLPSPPPQGWNRFNPFSGGQPAGFWSKVGGSAGSYRSPRMGIMTSPELAAQMQMENAGKKKEKGRWRRSRETEGRSSSQVSRGGSAEEGEIPVAPASVLPGWGAGWGRVSGRRQSGSMEIRLHDVGSLLK